MGNLRSGTYWMPKKMKGRKLFLQDGPGARMKEAEARYRVLDESWLRWRGRLSTRVMNLIRAYEITFEELRAVVG